MLSQPRATTRRRNRAATSPAPKYTPSANNTYNAMTAIPQQSQLNTNYSSQNTAANSNPNQLKSKDDVFDLFSFSSTSNEIAEENNDPFGDLTSTNNTNNNNNNNNANGYANGNASGNANANASAKAGDDGFDDLFSAFGFSTAATASTPPANSTQMSTAQSQTTNSTSNNNTKKQAQSDALPWNQPTRSTSKSAYQMSSKPRQMKTRVAKKKTLESQQNSHSNSADRPTKALPQPTNSNSNNSNNNNSAATPTKTKKKKIKKIDVLPLLHKGIRANKFKLKSNKSKVRRFYLTTNNFFFGWDAVGGSPQNTRKPIFGSKKKTVDPNRTIPIRSIRSLVKNPAYTMQTYNFIPTSQKSLTITIVYVQNGSEKKLNFMTYEAFHHVLFYEGLRQLWDAAKDPERTLSDVFELYVDFSKDILPKHLRPQKFKWEPLGAGDYSNKNGMAGSEPGTLADSTDDGDSNNEGPNMFLDTSGAHQNVDMFDPTAFAGRGRIKSF